MDFTEGNMYKFIYPNTWITMRRTRNEWVDKNAATISHLFEVTGNDSYKLIYSFQTDCIDMGWIQSAST